VPIALDVDPVEVPARSVVTFDPATIDGMPAGAYAAVFATLADPSIVVERVSTRTIDDAVTTTVLAGATSRPSDGFVPTSWHVTRAPGAATEAAILIHNADNVDGTVTVYAVGASGPVPVPGMEGLTLPRSSKLTLDLTDPAALGRTLVIETSNRVFVELAFPTGLADTRYSAWAVPQG
jgi:hypothetical protein